MKARRDPPEATGERTTGARSTSRSFASISIHNAKTHNRVNHQAITDSLTGLFNRRYFEDIMSREILRAGRHKREFSLALVDVDDFKKYNDAFGHQAGDDALNALA